MNLGVVRVLRKLICVMETRQLVSGAKSCGQP
jgi:hypothetical protein